MEDELEVAGPHTRLISVSRSARVGELERNGPGEEHTELRGDVPGIDRIPIDEPTGRACPPAQDLRVRTLLQRLLRD